MRSKLLMFGKLIGAAAVGSSFVVVANCSSSWSPNNPSTVPDGFAKWDYNWDKREPYSLIKPPKRSKVPPTEEEKDSMLEKKKTKSVRHIILIRHGQYHLDGHGDCEKTLTSLGEKQAALTGQRLKTLNIKFTELICSNMTRALQTMEIIKQNMDQPGLECNIKDPLLREGAPALPDPPVSHWHPDHHYFEDGARIEAAFRKYFHRAEPDQMEDSYEIIVCHANVIRYFICRAMQFPGEAWLRISLNHTSLTYLSILPSGRVILRAVGDSGHLPLEMLTTS